MERNRTKENDLANLCVALTRLITLWKKEINSEFMNFDYESQDCYRTLYEEFASQVALLEKYPPCEFSNDRNNIITGLRLISEQVVTIYEENKKDFRVLDREKLMYDTYKKNHSALKEIRDDQLKIHLLPYLGVNTDEKYYESNFYKLYGFILTDYHFELYLICKHILAVNYSNTKEYSKFRTFIEDAPVQPYFSMGLLYDLYVVTYSKQFEQISELDFYLSFNLMKLIPNLKIQKGENKRAYYLIHMLSSLIISTNDKSIWLERIYEQLDIDKNVYLSKYRSVKGRNATEEDIKYSDTLDTIFKAHK